ncbi:MAG: hypothetical protein KAG61_05230 [Bacteriovoracaceae bacterium]|nr:hypothetical protein [Bacteriovoracaceae bacterium]
MAMYRQIFVITALVTSFVVMANPCSTGPTEAEKRELCSGEDHPLAIKLCAESLEIQRDKYGRIKSHNYKSDARIPPVSILEALCSDSSLATKVETTECRQTLRIKRNLNGSISGYSYKTADRKVDHISKGEDRPIVGDGGILCSDTPKDSLARKTCIDGLNFDQNGDFITSYTRVASSKFVTDEEAKVVCEKYELGSAKYEYCKETTQAPRLVDGTLSFPNVSYSKVEMPIDFVPLRPICAKKPDAPPVTKLTAEPIVIAREATSASPARSRRPTSENKCEKLKGDALKKCVGERTGEQTLISFDSCNTVWDSKNNAKTRLGEDQSTDKAVGKGTRE